MTQASRSFSARITLFPREFGSIGAPDAGLRSMVANGSTGGRMDSGSNGMEAVLSEQAGIGSTSIASSRATGTPARSSSSTRSSALLSRTSPSTFTPTSTNLSSHSATLSPTVPSATSRSTTPIPSPSNTLSPVFGGQRSLFSDPTLLGIFATTVFGIVIAAILLLAFRRRTISGRKLDKLTKRPPLFPRFPSPLIGAQRPLWMSNRDLVLRAIGTAGIITVVFGISGLVLLPLSVAGVPSLSPALIPALSIAPRRFQSLLVKSPFFFSTLDDLTLYRLLRAHDLGILLSPSSSHRLAVITAILLVLSIIAAIWISREISRVQEQLDLWKESEAGGWEVGWLSISDKIWKSPAESTSRNKVWSRAVGQAEEQRKHLANEMTEGRLKRIFYACGLGARQVSSTVQEVFVENVFAIPDLTALDLLEQQRRSTIVALEITSAKFVACFESADIMPATEKRCSTSRSSPLQHQQSTIVPHAPLAHYRLASRLSLSSLSAALPLPRSAPSTPPPPTPPTKDRVKNTNHSSFTEIGLMHSREEWGLGEKLRYSERGRWSRLPPTTPNLDPLVTSPFPRSIYQLESRPNSAEPLTKSFLYREGVVERFSIDDEDESTFQLARTVDAVPTNGRSPPTTNTRRSLWPLSTPMTADSPQFEERSQTAVETKSPSFYPRIIPIAGVSPQLIEQLSTTKREQLSRLRRLDIEIENLQKVTREEMRSGKGVDGFIVVGREVCSIPGVRRIEGFSNDDIIWSKLSARSTSRLNWIRVPALVLTVLALLVPTFLSLCATADFSTRWNVSTGISQMTGLPLGLLVTLVPAAIAILFGGFSFVLIQGYVKSSNTISITESRRRLLEMTMWTFMASLIWIISCSSFFCSRLDQPRFDGIVLLSPLFLAISILLALVLPVWSLGGVEGWMMERELRSASTPREKFLAQYRPTNSSRALYVPTIVLCLLLSTFVMIPLVSIPLTICIVLYLLVERRKCSTKHGTNSSASIFHLVVLRNISLFLSLPPLLLALLLLSRRILSLGLSSIAGALIVLILRTRQFFVDRKRRSRNRFSVFTKHSLNGFQVGAGDGSFLDGNALPQSSITTASLIPRRSLASIFDLIDSFSSSGSSNSISTSASHSLDRPAPLPLSNERIDWFVDIDKASSFFRDDSVAPRVMLRSGATKRDYYPPVLSAKGVVWLPLGEEEEANEMEKWGVEVVCA